MSEVGSGSDVVSMELREDKDGATPFFLPSFEEQ